MERPRPCCKVLAQADWLQEMIRDAVNYDVELKQWRNSLSPHMVVLRGDLQPKGYQPQCVVTDAKSLYDCLFKEHPHGKEFATFRRPALW